MSRLSKKQILVLLFIMKEDYLLYDYRILSLNKDILIRGYPLIILIFPLFCATI